MIRIEEVDGEHNGEKETQLLMIYTLSRLDASRADASKRGVAVAQSYVLFPEESPLLRLLLVVCPFSGITHSVKSRWRRESSVPSLSSVQCKTATTRQTRRYRKE